MYYSVIVKDVTMDTNTQIWQNMCSYFIKQIPSNEKIYFKKLKSVHYVRMIQIHMIKWRF